jgi:small GTP-binding protein
MFAISKRVISVVIKNVSSRNKILFQVYPRIECETVFSFTTVISNESEEKKKDADIPIENIRNFSIIAHVDHGKSTLADRILELTGAIMKNSGTNQVLDRLQVERERGITVKAQTASLNYTVNNREYLLNLIDTPGHVDFSNEVSRSLAACQGVILLVDANQGVQAQTVANFYMAFAKELVIIPVLNKVDLKNADPEKVSAQLRTLFDINEEDILQVNCYKYGLPLFFVHGWMHES